MSEEKELFSEELDDKKLDSVAGGANEERWQECKNCGELHQKSALFNGGYCYDCCLKLGYTINPLTQPDQS